MWDEILASQDYINQLASSRHEDDLPLDWKLVLSSMQESIKQPKECLAELKNRQNAASTTVDCRSLAIYLWRSFGHELADISCLVEDPWAQMRRDRFWKRWNQWLPESFASDPEFEKYQRIYASHLAIEPPGNIDRAHWLWNRLENGPDIPSYKELIWKCLSRAQHFEQFLHKKFIGQKRFSLEGSETLIPVLEVLFRQFTKGGGKHVAIGMTHRGRLNVLAHCLGKSYTHILKEFDPSSEFHIEDMGDVKYHKGHASCREFDEGNLFVEMLPNPSHLESVDPVLVGFCAAKQKHKSFEEVLPVLLHGDAALSGQGIVYETLQLSGINGYGPTGVIHIVVNNQIGFTANPSESRQTEFCSDIAKTFGIPVFHASIEKPLECARAIFLALEYRNRFKSDVFVDLIGYRKWGHNESDEPRYTNANLYKAIDAVASPLEIYAKEIGLEKELIEQHGNLVLQDLQDSFEKTHNENRSSKVALEELQASQSEGLAEHFLNQMRGVETSVSEEEVQKWAKDLFEISGRSAHPKIASLYSQRYERVLSGAPFDWACAEMLAYASLLKSGHHVRLSGQDSIRGTFSHRQSGLLEKESDSFWFPINRAGEGASFEVYNSPLSEFGVLGFEYGYSLASSEDLVIWEAQFGDFANGAQVIIDQFISSAQSKWGISSRLALFLPHGFEGQGPEHSSARIERFLALSARGNWCVAQVSTPAQFFHLLRRHILQPIKRPLVLFMPKGLLRHPECVSNSSHLTSGSFQEVLAEISPESTKVVICSGRVYYDIHAKVKQSGASLIRVEQLYPLALDKIFQLFESCPLLREVIWIQEEPINMGPAVWIKQNFQGPVQSRGWKWTMLGRDRANCIATGYAGRHKLELELLMHQLQEALKI